MRRRTTKARCQWAYALNLEPAFSSLRPARFSWSASRNLGRSSIGSPQFTNFPSLCACSELSLTNLFGWEYKTNSLRMLKKLDPARVRDSWCWPKGARPLGTRIILSQSDCQTWLWACTEWRGVRESRTSGVRPSQRSRFLVLTKKTRPLGRECRTSSSARIFVVRK